MQSTILYTMSFITLTSCTAIQKTDDTAIDTSGGMEEPTSVEVLMSTSMGDIVIELDIENAPETSSNFLRYVDDGFFDGDDGLGATTFHRSVSGFVIQGGGYTSEGVEKEAYAPIVNEAIDSGLSNLRGTLSMARTDDPDSATSQFFVNLVDNEFLDAGGSTEAGYAVFGTVTSGLDIVDNIGNVSVGQNDQPIENVVIEDVERIDE